MADTTEQKLNQHPQSDDGDTLSFMDSINQLLEMGDVQTLDVDLLPAIDSRNSSPVPINSDNDAIEIVEHDGADDMRTYEVVDLDNENESGSESGSLVDVNQNDMPISLSTDLVPSAKRQKTNSASRYGLPSPSTVNALSSGDPPDLLYPHQSGQGISSLYPTAPSPYQQAYAAMNLPLPTAAGMGVTSPYIRDPQLRSMPGGSQIYMNSSVPLPYAYATPRSVRPQLPPPSNLIPAAENPFAPLQRARPAGYVRKKSYMGIRPTPVQSQYMSNDGSDSNQSTVVDLSEEVDDMDDLTIRTVDACIEATTMLNDDTDDVLMTCAQLKTNVVGLGQYTGLSLVNDQDVIDLQRPEFDDDDDENTIEVVTRSGVIVGVLPSDVTQQLAPLVDEGRICLQGMIDGAKSSTYVPVMMTVTTLPSNADAVRDLLEFTRLVSIDLTRKPKRVKVRSILPAVNVPQIQNGSADVFRQLPPMFATTPKSSVLSRPSSTMPAISPLGASSFNNLNSQHNIQANTASLSHTSLLAATQAQEEWQRLLQSGSDYDNRGAQVILDSLGPQESDLADLPEAKQPMALTSLMLGYQLQGLGWMLNAENPMLPTETKRQQFWIARKYSTGEQVYYNFVTREVLNEEPKLYRGGILADDMGLGKTIQVLALILSDPRGAGFVEQPGILDPAYAKTTLIVCPLSVIGNWMSQIEQHVVRGRLKVHIFHGDKRNKNPVFLRSQDIVITTYTVMSMDGPNSLLHTIQWRRVVLDEGHNIRVKSTKQCIAACALTTERRWVLSGTPIQNKLEDIYSLLKFLRFTPFDQLNIWKTCIEKPIKSGHVEVMQTFKHLMQILCMRRTKTMKLQGKPILELPPITFFVHKVQFRPAEREAYSIVENKSREALADIIAGSTEGSTIFNLGLMLKFLTRLRQLCNHRILVERSDKDILNLNKDTSKDGMLTWLEMNLAEDCPVCMSAMRTPCITKCGHWFCLECVQPLVQRTKTCPVCDVPLRAADVYEAGAPDVAPERSLDMSDWSVVRANYVESTKIEMLIKFLVAARNKDPRTKSVVFSQWTSMLDLVELSLTSQNFRFVRLDGKMARKHREESINSFQYEPTVLVFLISLTSGSTGLNLVAATNCFLIDPWWNPQIERQAIDRTYRIGQTRPVTVIRFAVENTVEERVLELQERKRQMAAAAFDETNMQVDKIVRANRMDDIRALLGA